MLKNKQKNNLPNNPGTKQAMSYNPLLSCQEVLWSNFSFCIFKHSEDMCWAMPFKFSGP